MQFINAWRSSRVLHGVSVLVEVIKAASKVNCCAYWLIALLQSVSLDHAHFGSSRHSAGRWMLSDAVRKAWSLPAMGPQHDLPQVHSTPSWTKKSSMFISALWTRRSRACLACVRLTHFRFASCRSCSYRICSSNSLATPSCARSGRRECRITLASPPARTAAVG